MKKNEIILASILIMLIVFSYINHFKNGYYISESTSIQNDKKIVDIKNNPILFSDSLTFKTTKITDNLEPIITSKPSKENFPGKSLNRFYFHFLSFIIFLFQGVLIYFFFAKILENSVQNSNYKIIALIASGWYCLHPANAETINYIQAGTDMYAAFFIMLAFVIYQYYPNLRTKYLYLIPFFLGSFFKETAILFAPLLFVYQFIFEWNPEKNANERIFNLAHFLITFKKSMPAFLLSAVFILYHLYKTSGTTSSTDSSRVLYLFSQPFIIFLYFRSLFLPFWLTAETDRKVISSLFDVQVFDGLLFLSLLIYITYRTLQNKETFPIAFGILWFLIALIPASGFFPMPEVMSDRRVYLPYIGLVFSVVWGIYHYSKLYLKNHNLLLAMVLFLIFFYAFGTIQRNKVWKNEETLWYDVTIKSPLNARGLMYYGMIQMVKDKHNEALQYFEKAMLLKPDYTDLYINSARIKSLLNFPLEAEVFFQKAIDIDPKKYLPYFYYAKFLIENKRIEESKIIAEKTLELSPSFMDGRHLLMEIYHELDLWDQLKILTDKSILIDRYDSTSMAYLEIIKKNNTTSNKKNDLTEEKLKKRKNFTKKKITYQEYFIMSLTYYKSVMYEKSIKACYEILKLQPEFAEPYNIIGLAYNNLGKYDDAIKNYEKALKIRPDFEEAKINLYRTLSQKALLTFNK